MESLNVLATITSTILFSIIVHFIIEWIKHLWKAYQWKHINPQTIVEIWYAWDFTINDVSKIKAKTKLSNIYLGALKKKWTDIVYTDLPINYKTASRLFLVQREDSSPEILDFAQFQKKYKQFQIRPWDTMLEDVKEYTRALRDWIETHNKLQKLISEAR